MKRQLTLYLSLVVVAGCQLSALPSPEPIPVTYWLNYYPTQCNTSPWGDTLETTAITSYYQTVLGVTVEAVEVTAPQEGFISCSACGCLSGSQVSIQTNAAGKTVLEEHGFTGEELGAAVGTGLVDDFTGDSTVIQPLETNTNVNLDETEALTAEAEQLSATDQALQTRAEQLKTQLQTYYSQHGSYPDTLVELNTTLDTTGLTYTPIGITPADYYDLAVEYSTGRSVLNP